MNPTIVEKSRILGKALAKVSWHLVTAESCTGGGVAAAITAVPDSSHWFEYGIVSYANKAKQKLLGVSEQSLDRHGAVSEPVVIEMVDGALALSDADIAVSISGIAGPGGGTADKPVGTVWFCWGTRDGRRRTRLHHLDGDRLDIQEQAIMVALDGLIEWMSAENTV
jgi:nicotinamide-nucleotide amidase